MTSQSTTLEPLLNGGIMSESAHDPDRQKRPYLLTFLADTGARTSSERHHNTGSPDPDRAYRDGTRSALTEPWNRLSADPGSASSCSHVNICIGMRVCVCSEHDARATDLRGDR